MTQLPWQQNFGPFPLSVILDGSGNGTVTFRPAGQAATVSNIYAAVSTLTLQAVCTMYKGQIGPQYALVNTNSGSTGASASGRIPLKDGEPIFVVWTGGDAGATATATFSGSTIPFTASDGVGTSLSWDNPIAAGDGSLVYPALKSPNYVPGVSGWKIARDGSVEFNSAVIRGSVSAGNGTVLLNGGGLHIESPSSGFQYDINITGGFSARNKPDDGEFAQMEPGQIIMRSPSPTPFGRTVTSSQYTVNTTNPSGTVERVNNVLLSPAINGGSTSALLLEGESSAGDAPKLSLLADVIHISGYVEDGDLHDVRNHEYLRGENGVFLMSFGGLSAATVVVTFTNTFSASPAVMVNIEDGTAQTARVWNARAISVSTTGFTFFAFTTSAATGTWSNVRCTWVATEYTP